MLTTPRIPKVGFGHRRPSGNAIVGVFALEILLGGGGQLFRCFFSSEARAPRYATERACAAFRFPWREMVPCPQISEVVS